MTSTELKIGLTTSARPSSRVLKPPGGGHTNIFGDSEVTVNAPRPKYNQQNSSNLNACMGSTDPNHIVEKLREEKTSQPNSAAAAAAQKPAAQTTGEQSSKAANNNAATAAAPAATNGSNNNVGASAAPASRGRVPPGGFSSGGFW